MKIFNEDLTQELEPNAIDKSKGELVKKTITKHFDKVEPVEEQGHWETIRTYPNGGSDVEWVVDIPGVEAIEEHDEIEEVLVFTLYTEKELQVMKLEEEIDKNLELLYSTDYRAIKYFEGYYTDEEYEVYKQERQGYRDEINRIQSEIEKLEKE